MEFLNVFLPIVLYIVAITLLIILIILGIKLINLIDKVDRDVDSVEEKVNSFNGALAVMTKAADGIASISDSVINGVSLTVSKLMNTFTKRSKKKKEEEDYYA